MRGTSSSTCAWCSAKTKSACTHCLSDPAKTKKPAGPLHLCARVCHKVYHDNLARSVGRRPELPDADPAQQNGRDAKKRMSRAQRNKFIESKKPRPDDEADQAGPSGR